MTLVDLADGAQRVAPELPVRQVLDALVYEYHGRGTMYRAQDVSEFTGLDVEIVARCLRVLDGPPLRIVAAQWVYVDDGGNLHDLDPDDVREAIRSKEFFHPDSGSRVFDYEDAIHLVFVSGPQLDAALEHRRFTATG
jgi:hypothetical protein